MQKPPTAPRNFMAREVSCSSCATSPHQLWSSSRTLDLANQSVNARPMHRLSMLVFINIFTDLYINLLDNSEY